MVTGFYGGMGFNPLPTFDWNVAGGGNPVILVTPFFSAIQQYGARILSGLIIIAMYYTNYYWSAFMPINSNEAFDNTGKIYEVGNILNNQTQTVDVEKYKQYGPPYFSGANVVGQGAWFAWYPLTFFYTSITEWRSLRKAFIGMFRSLRYRKSIYEQYKDPHTRMMSKYKEVADWWFWCVLLVSLIFGIVALESWPVHTPVWTLFAVMAISLILLIPSAILYAVTNVQMGFNVLFQLLGGVWFAGNPEANIICTVYGQNFDYQTDLYITDLKMAHYAKLPPRAVFRGQCISVVLNCFIFVGMLDWMVDSYDDGTLCQWNNTHHFVCTNAVLVFASAVEYGAFGVKNMFQLYPILPWCFLMGALIGIFWGLARLYGERVRDICRRSFSETKFLSAQKYVFKPLSLLKWFNPAAFWHGALNWTGGNNLSYATCWIYISFVFMYHIKRHYGSWWEKYNYLLEAGFDVGVAISSIVQTFAFDFPNVSLSWWGNNVEQAGVDYLAYNQNATLLPIPQKGYFGISPEQYPLNW